MIPKIALVALLAIGLFVGVGVSCPPDPYCGDEVCNEGEDCRSCPQDCGICPPECGDGECNGEENCMTCEVDCGECEEPEPTPKTRARGGGSHCDHCFFVGGLDRYYNNLLYGYWYNYAVNCGIEYDQDTPPQNIRWACKLKQEEMNRMN